MNERMDELIDEVLRSEPQFELRKDFKDRVVQVIRKKELKNQRKLYLWMVLGTLMIFGFGYATIAYFMPSMLQNFNGLNSVSDQLIPGAVLAGLAILIIQYLDKRLVKDKIVHLN